MTFNLGRANFIIDTDPSPALAADAKYFAEKTKQAKEITERLAEQLKIQASDVTNAATIEINAAKKAAAERAKIARDEANDRKKTTQEILKINQEAYKAEEAAAKKAAAERKKILIDTIKNEVAELKRAETERNKLLEQRRRIQIASIQKEREDAKAIADAEIKELNRVRNEQKKLEQAQAQAQTKRPTAGSRSVIERFASGLPGDLATIAGFGAIASGAILVREALVRVTEATLKQQEAQRGLNAALGDTQILYKNNADALAKQFGLLNSEVEAATAKFGTLKNQTALTGAQIRELQKGVIDVQAAFGGDLAEAFRSASGGVLGETEAFEKYGLVLQDSVLKNSDKLTESERRRFTTMSESEKQMIRYRLIMEHLATVQGAATAKAKEAQGGFDALNRSVDELAKTLGKGLVEATGEGARGLAGFLDQTNEALIQFQRVSKAVEEIRKERNAQKERGETPDFFEGLGVFSPSGHARIEKQIQIQKDVEAAVKAAQEGTARIREAEEDARKARTAARDKEEAELKVAEERAKEILQRSHDAEIKRIDERIKAAEFERQNRLDALEKAKTAELRSIEDVENARRKASDAELARIQNEKDAKIQAADDRRDSELERLETEKQAAEAAAEENIRQLQIAKDERERLNEDTKANELERLEDEKDARDTARRHEDDAIKDSIENKERLLEDEHRKTLRRIEREGEAARAKYDREILKIKHREDKEDDDGKKRIRQIEEEADARIKSIDTEIDKLEEAERVRDSIRRRRELNNRLTDSQRALREATGTQDPVARQQAQNKLISAIRLGDPVAVKKAQDELAEIVGQGTRAIEDAQRNLEDVQIDIRDNDVKETEDAQKQKLQAEKDRIKEEADEEKQQAQDRDKRRKDRSDKDREAAKKTLDDALKKIEAKQEAEEDANRKAKREIEDLTNFNSRTLRDRREEEDNAYKDSVEAAQNRYKEEQRAIEATYTDEKTGAIPAIRRALKATQDDYATQTELVQNRYKAERREIAETYDDPEHGAIAVHRRLEEDARQTYGRLVEITAEKYAEIRQAVEREYVAGDGKTGIIDKLSVLKAETTAKLAEVLKEFELHKKGLVGPDGVIELQWKDATELAKKYFDYIDARQKQLEEDIKNEAARNRTLGRDPSTGRPIQGPVLPGASPAEGGGPGERGGPAGDPPPTPPTQPGQPPTLPQKLPQINQYQEFNDVPFADQDAGCGPAALVWFSNFIGKHLNSQQAFEIAKKAGWDRELGMHGPSAFSNALGRVGVGNYVQWNPSEKLIDELAKSGVPFAISTGKHYFQVQGGSSGGLNVGGSGTALKNGSSIMSYSQVASALGADGIQAVIVPRDGELPGSKGYNPRDNGYVFRNPTLTYDMRTGDKNVLAEYGPERLLGRKDTQMFDSMGLSARLRRPAGVRLDHDAMGAASIGAQTVLQTNNSEGDHFTYNGVAPENIIKQWRADQRKQTALRGRVQR